MSLTNWLQQYLATLTLTATDDAPGRAKFPVTAPNPSMYMIRHTSAKLCQLSLNVRQVFPAVDVFEQHLNEEAGLLRVGHPDNGTAVTSGRVIACVTETVTHVKHLQTALQDKSGTRAALSRLKAQLA